MDDASELPTDAEYIDARPSVLGSETQKRRTAKPTEPAEESDSDGKPLKPKAQQRLYTRRDRYNADVRFYHANSLWREICDLAGRRKAVNKSRDEPRATPTEWDSTIAARCEWLLDIVMSQPMSYTSWDDRWIQRRNHWKHAEEEELEARWASQTEGSEGTPNSDNSQVPTHSRRPAARANEQPRTRPSALTSPPRQQTEPWATRPRKDSDHPDRSDRTSSTLKYERRDSSAYESDSASSTRQRIASPPTRHRQHSHHTKRYDRMPTRAPSPTHITRKDERRDPSVRQSGSTSSPRPHNAVQPAQPQYQSLHRNRSVARVRSPHVSAQTRMPSITTQRWLDEPDDQKSVLDAYAGLRSPREPTATWTRGPLPIRTRGSQDTPGTVKSEADELLFTGRRQQHSSGGRR